MSLDSNAITTLVLDWLNKEQYSRQHWETVAQESLKKTNNNVEESVTLMAKSLKDFHYLYANNLINKNNVL